MPASTPSCRRTARLWQAAGFPCTGAVRNNFFAAFVTHGRVIDERFGPLVTHQQASQWQTSTAEPPTATSWAGPRRYRRLAINPAFQPFGCVEHPPRACDAGCRRRLVQRTCPLARWRPRWSRARCCCGVQLPRRPAGCVAHPVRDVVFQSESSEVDGLGPSRLIDIATFIGRTFVRHRRACGPNWRESRLSTLGVGCR